MKASRDLARQNWLRTGFTLVELLVAMALGLLAVSVLYRSYVAFAEAARGQEQALELGQNLRLGMEHLAREIRMAGYHSSLVPVDATTGFLVAAPDNLRMTRDLGGGGDDGRDNDHDGLVDEADEAVYSDGELDDNYEDLIYRLAGPNLNGSYDLRREDLNGATDTIIENVDALNFVYLDQDGVPLARPANGATVATTPPVGRPDEIRSVEISLVVRATNEDYAHVDHKIYRNGQDSNGDGLNDVIMTGGGDNFHRRVLTVRVKCRNLGLL